ncbi:hypothetical protein KCU88_g4950, partial [Aureobasidium melanogenum]
MTTRPIKAFSKGNIRGLIDRRIPLKPRVSDLAPPPPPPPAPQGVLRVRIRGPRLSRSPSSRGSSCASSTLTTSPAASPTSQDDFDADEAFPLEESKVAYIQQRNQYCNIRFPFLEVFQTASFHRFSRKMAQKIITVFGATGNQGGSTLSAILNNPELSAKYKIRAITRDPSKPSAQALASKGAELAKADLTDLASVKSAIAGSYGVFAVTNYWEKMSKEGEFQQGRNIVDACKEQGIKHLVWSSLPHVTKLTDGHLAKVEHFDSKAEVAEYAEQVKGEDMIVSYFMPGYFMSNLPSMINPDPETGVVTLSAPWNPTETWVPMIDIQKDTGAFTAGLFEAGAEANGVYVQGIKGKEVRFVEQPATVESAAQLGNRIAEELTQNMILIRDYSYYGKGTEKKQAEIPPAATSGTNSSHVQVAPPNPHDQHRKTEQNHTPADVHVPTFFGAIAGTDGQPYETLRHRVVRSYKHHTWQYWLVATVSNALLFLQIVIAASLTVLGAFDSVAARRATIGLGAANTFRNDLAKVVEQLDDAEANFRDPTYPGQGTEHEVLEQIRKAYRDARNDAEANYPDFWVKLNDPPKQPPPDAAKGADKTVPASEAGPPGGSKNSPTVVAAAHPPANSTVLSPKISEKTDQTKH